MGWLTLELSCAIRGWNVPLQAINGTLFGLRLSHLVDPAVADVQLNLFRPSLGWFVRFFFILDDTDLSIAFYVDQLHF
jgi:hypothetical protein